MNDLFGERLVPDGWMDAGRCSALLGEMMRMSREEDGGRLEDWCDGPPLSLLVFLVACGRVGQNAQ